MHGWGLQNLLWSSRLPELSCVTSRCGSSMGSYTNTVRSGPSTPCVMNLVADTFTNRDSGVFSLCMRSRVRRGKASEVRSFSVRFRCRSFGGRTHNESG